MPVHTEDQLITGNDATGTNTAELCPPDASSAPHLPFAFLWSSEGVYSCVIEELLWIFVVIVGCSISLSTSEQSCSTLFAAG